MNIADVLENSHQQVIKAVEDLPESEWEVPGAWGEWSVKDVIAHLAAYELALIDILNTFLGEQPSPYALRMINDHNEFNAAAIHDRRYHTAQQVMNEYQDAQVRSASLIEQIPPEKREQKGTMPWYKPQLSLVGVINNLDLHIREHCAQIANFRQKSEAAR